MDDSLSFPRAIGEGVLVGALAIACTLVLGFLVAGLRHPIAISVIVLAAGLAWTFRPELRQRRYLVLVMLAVLAFSIPFLISPSYIGRILP